MPRNLGRTLLWRGLPSTCNLEHWFPNFSESRRPFQLKNFFFSWRPIIIIYFGRAGGGLLLQEIRIIYKIKSIIGDGLQLSLSCFIYSSSMLF